VWWVQLCLVSRAELKICVESPRKKGTAVPLEFYVLRFVYLFFSVFFFLLILQPYMCHTHTHAGREDTGGMVTYIIVKSICKASPCHRHCAPCSSTPCPTNLIPLTARGACGNLFGLSNAHFLLRVLALCVCVCACAGVCVSPRCALECICVCLQRNQYGGAWVIAAGFTRSCGVSGLPASSSSCSSCCSTSSCWWSSNHPAKSYAFVLGSYL